MENNNKNNISQSESRTNQKSKKEFKYNPRILEKMPEFNIYHKDVIRALLTEKEYTKSQAKEILDAYYSNKGGNN